MSEMRYLIEYAQLHLLSLEQDFEKDKTDYLIGQIEATKHLINVSNDIANGALFLTDDNNVDTMNKTIEGKEMEHEHFWDTPAVAQPNLVAECDCGEQLEQVYETTN